MRSVLLLLPGAFSGYGGIEMYNRQLTRAFLELGQERGFAVRALILNDDSEDVDSRYIPQGAERPKGFRRRKAAFSGQALLRAALDRPSLVVWGHLHFARLATIVRRVSPSSRHWFVAHGVEAWQPLPTAVRRGLALADRILSVSDYTRRELARNGGVPLKKISLLPNALDEVWQKQFAPRSDEPPHATNGRPVLLTVARLDATERYKGIDSIIRVLPDLDKVVPDIRYDIVGDGDDRARLEALARELNVTERVCFRGPLGPEDLAAAYRECSVYVMPSSHEGFGIVFLEAALFAKPSIGGMNGGTPEVIVDGVTGILVGRDDPHSLAKAIIRLLMNAPERIRMGAAARERLQDRFTYGSFLGVLRKHLEEDGASGTSRRFGLSTARTSGRTSSERIVK